MNGLPRQGVPRPLNKENKKSDEVVGGIGALGANPRNPRNGLSIRVRCCRFEVGCADAKSERENGGNRERWCLT